MKGFEFYVEHSEYEDENENQKNSQPKYQDKTTKTNQKVMTREELIRCIDMIRNGTAEEQEKATTEILVRNEPYIKSLIKKFYPTYAARYMDDMISCGNIGILCGLFKANPPYDPTISTFSTFFSRYIIHEISDCISQMVHNTSPHYSATAKKINRAIATLQERGIREPTITDIMAETKLGSEAIQTGLLMQSANSALPLDHPNVMDLPAQEQEDPLEIIEQLELLEDLQNAMKKLSENERRILELQHGLNGEKRHTQAEIAKILGKGVTINQVHRMRANAYRTLYHDSKLRAHYENEYKRQEQEYTLLVEQTIIPLILSVSALEQEMQVLETIPIEEISI